MSRRIAPWLALFALVAILMAACGGRTLTASPPNDDDGSSADGVGGAGGMSSAVGGNGGDAMGGAGPGQGPGQGPGPGPGPTTTGGPTDCFACLGDNCPDALACFTDPDCIQGVICTVSMCLQGGGMPDFPCVIDCFNGDIGAAFQAIQALTCVFNQCQAECSGFLPFPGP